MDKVVFALADNQKHADRIVNKLLQAGFSNDAISVLLSDKEGRISRTEVTTAERQFVQGRMSEDRFENEQWVGDRNEGFTKEDTTKDFDRPVANKKGKMGVKNTTKAPEGATTGAITGGVIGGSLGLLAGIGALAIPGLGPFIAAGPILAALSGSGIGGALGLIVGALVGLGIPEYEAKKYEAGLKQGGVLLCVHTVNSQEVDKAKTIFEKENATDISTSREKSSAR